ncbi:MAG: hypothetical protein AAB336_12090, partial [Acidobacteriota bacterium]
DKEIERMENALKGFRFQPTAPPILPVNILQSEEKPKFGFFANYFKFAMAGFACLAILLAGFGIFLRVSNNEIEDVADLSKPIVTPIKLGNPVEPKVIDPIIKPPAIGQNIVKKINQPNPVSVPRTTKLVFRKTEPKVKPMKEIKLTTEEKFAYEQLMLALSITGKQLKEVKDKANSVEDSTAIKSLK